MSTLHRLVLWNIDHTLVDVGRVTREAYAEAFRKVTGRPLVRLAPTAGRTESEIIFETLAYNDIVTTDDHLAAFIAALATAFESRRADVRAHGRVLPGAREALGALAGLPNVLQSVLTGSIEASATLKLTELGLHRHLDLEVGGYGSETYPKGALIEIARTRASRKYRIPFDESVAWLGEGLRTSTVLIADSPHDVRAAQIAAAPVIGVATGGATETDLRTAGADAVLPTLADTAAVVAAVQQLTDP